MRVYWRFLFSCNSDPSPTDSRPEFFSSSSVNCCLCMNKCAHGISTHYICIILIKLYHFGDNTKPNRNHRLSVCSRSCARAFVWMFKQAGQFIGWFSCRSEVFISNLFISSASSTSLHTIIRPNGMCVFLSRFLLLTKQ